MKLTNILEDNAMLFEQHRSYSQQTLTESCNGLNALQRAIVEGIHKDLTPLVDASLSANRVDRLLNCATIKERNELLATSINTHLNKIDKWCYNTSPVLDFSTKFDSLAESIDRKFNSYSVTENLKALYQYSTEYPEHSATIIGLLTAISSLAPSTYGNIIAEQLLTNSIDLNDYVVESAEVQPVVVTTSTKVLSEGQVYLIFDKVCERNNRMIAESKLVDITDPFAHKASMWDRVQAKPGQLESTYTTSLTPNALTELWENAGSPRGAGDLAVFLGNNRINGVVVQHTFESLRIKLSDHDLQLLSEGPFGQAVAKGTRKLAANVGAVAGGIAGIPSAVKRGFSIGKRRVGGGGTADAGGTQGGTADAGGTQGGTADAGGTQGGGFISDFKSGYRQGRSGKIDPAQPDSEEPAASGTAASGSGDEVSSNDERIYQQIKYNYDQLKPPLKQKIVQALSTGSKSLSEPTTAASAPPTAAKQSTAQQSPTTAQDTASPTTAQDTASPTTAQATASPTRDLGVPTSQQSPTTAQATASPTRDLGVPTSQQSPTTAQATASPTRDLGVPTSQQSPTTAQATASPTRDLGVPTSQQSPTTAQATSANKPREPLKPGSMAGWQSGQTAQATSANKPREPLKPGSMAGWQSGQTAQATQANNDDTKSYTAQGKPAPKLPTLRAKAPEKAPATKMPVGKSFATGTNPANAPGYGSQKAGTASYNAPTSNSPSTKNASTTSSKPLAKPKSQTPASTVDDTKSYTAQGKPAPKLPTLRAKAPEPISAAERTRTQKQAAARARIDQELGNRAPEPRNAAIPGETPEQTRTRKQAAATSEINKELGYSDTSTKQKRSKRSQKKLDRKAQVTRKAKVADSVELDIDRMIAENFTMFRKHNSSLTEGPLTAVGGAINKVVEPAANAFVKGSSAISNTVNKGVNAVYDIQDAIKGYGKFGYRGRSATPSNTDDDDNRNYGGVDYGDEANEAIYVKQALSKIFAGRRLKPDDIDNIETFLNKVDRYQFKTSIDRPNTKIVLGKLLNNEKLTYNDTSIARVLFKAI